LFKQALGERDSKRQYASGRYFSDHERFALAQWDSDAVRLETLTKPTLVDGAEGDRRNSPYRGRNAALLRRRRNAQRVSIPGVSHPMPLENPVLVAQTILDFAGRPPIK
jgi:pimeloyl-ACP methyl ester carboxylesterase